MRAASAQFDGAAITLVTADAQIALMTIWHPGERRTGVRGADGAIQTLASGRPQISNLFRGAATGRFAVAIGIPVYAEPGTAGQRVVTSTIGLGLPQARLATALEAQRSTSAPGWVTTVVDREGTIVARTLGGEGLVGRPMRPEMLVRVTATEEGIVRKVTTREGIPVIIAFSHGPRSGYAVILTMPEVEFEAQLRAALGRILGIGAILTAAGVGLAMLLARRTVAAFRRVGVVVMGGAESGGTGLREADALAAAFATALTERARIERQHRLVVAELNHRVKNVLATVQALAAQTLRGPSGKDPASFAAGLDSRLRALARAHDLLTAASWETMDLDAVARAALAPWLTGDTATARITLSCVPRSGRVVRLFPGQAQTLALALHELATNATRHGALSVPNGSVEVSCRESVDGEVRLEWSESNGPPITGPPTQRGFGMRLLEKALARDLGSGAAVELRFEPGGLQAVVRFTRKHSAQGLSGG
jgi:two-component sensor histidine kinase